MNNSDDSNKAVELIKAIYFHPKGLETFIDTTIKQLAISGRNISDKTSKDKIKTIFTSNSFLKPFAEKFKTFFTDEETELLLEIYQSDLMAKLLKHSEELFSPLYTEMTKQVEDI